MAFQYDFAATPSEVSWAELFRNVEHLLYSLIHRREGADDRPIIFICYSFGAFILKKAGRRFCEVIFVACVYT